MPRLKAPRRREQLIEVAAGVFSRLGYDAATTAAIAQEAGITEPVLYRHFASKQEMFVAVVHSLTTVAMRGWQEVLGLPLRADEQLRLACQHLHEAVRISPEPYRLVHGAAAISRDGVVLKVIREHFRELEELFASLLCAGQKQGTFRTDFEADVMAPLLVASGIGFALRQFALVPDGVSSKAFADFMLRQVQMECEEAVARPT